MTPQIGYKIGPYLGYHSKVPYLGTIFGYPFGAPYFCTLFEWGVPKSVPFLY